MARVFMMIVFILCGSVGLLQSDIETVAVEDVERKCTSCVHFDFVDIPGANTKTMWSIA